MSAPTTTAHRPAAAARTLTVVVLLLTVAQLAVASTSSLPQFAGKGFGARLVLYPVLMLLVPAAWAARRRGLAGAPWAGFALVMTPFLVDVTGNSLDLYDRVTWWDDANHLVNWFVLCLGLALVVGAEHVRPRWAVAVLVTGFGAALAVVWELGEYVAFIRQGTELSTAYRDTLGDLALGTLGAAVAGALVRRRAAR